MTFLVLLTLSCTTPDVIGKTVEKADMKNNLEITNQEDSLLLFPLEKIYSSKTIEYINEDKSFEISTKLAMSFFIKNDTIYIGNNDKQEVQAISCKNKSIDKFLTYKIDKKSADASDRIFEVDNKLYISKYFSSLTYDIKNSKVIDESENSFGKNQFNLTRIFNGYQIIGLKLIDNAVVTESKKYDIGVGSDFGFYEKTDKYFIIKTDQYSGDAVKLISINNNGTSSSFNFKIKDIDMSVFGDVDIISINENEINFVLKSDVFMKSNDYLIKWDFKENKLINSYKIPNLLQEDSFLGDPAVFSTGTTYVFGDGKLWRMMTTKKGLCFENWRM